MPKILFVEDDESFVKAYLAKLESEGFNVNVAGNGQSAVFSAKKDLPDCIILDIMLEGNMNGFDVLEALKNDPTTKNVPVLVLTNLDSEEKVAKQIGASEYLVKTKTDPMAVAATIMKLVNKDS